MVSSLLVYSRRENKVSRSVRMSLAMPCLMTTPRFWWTGSRFAGGQGEAEQQWKLSELEKVLQKETDILCRMRESRRHAWC